MMVRIYRLTRAMWILALMALAMTASASEALEVKVPERTSARASISVDEAGVPLFGAKPGKVEVTNLPASPAGEPWSVVLEAPHCSSDPVGAPSLSFVVPEGKILVLTDIEGTYCACGRNAVYPSMWQCSYAGLELRDALGATKLVWEGTTNTDNNGGPAPLFKHRSYTSGVPLEAGVVTFQSSTGNPVGEKIVLMGRLYPAP